MKHLAYYRDYTAHPATAPAGTPSLFKLLSVFLVIPDSSYTA